MKAAVRPCPICNEDAAEVLLHIPFVLPPESPLPDAYDIVSCCRCGFVYADTHATQADYDRYYHDHSKYEDSVIASGSGQTSFDLTRISAQADRICQHINIDARILDIGCARGGLLLALKKRGYRDLAGVDGAAACVAALVQDGITATEARLSSLGNAGLRPGFDLVILSHVLEHVVDLKPILSAAAALLAPGGAIYVETPDASSYTGRPFVPYYFFDSEHINHFDTDSLAMLARACGLTQIAAENIEFLVADGLTYPACWSWLQSAKDMPRTPITAERLRTAVKSYIAESTQRNGSTILSGLAESQRPVVLWGAGSYAQRLFGSGALNNCNIVAIVDRDHNKQGKSFAGHLVHAPESILPPPGAIIAIAAAVHFEAITEDARRLWEDCEAVAIAGHGANIAERP